MGWKDEENVLKREHTFNTVHRAKKARMEKKKKEKKKKKAGSRILEEMPEPAMLATGNKGRESRKNSFNNSKCR